MKSLSLPPGQAAAPPPAGRRSPPRGACRVGGVARLACAGLVAVLGFAGSAGLGLAAEPAALRFGISARSFADVNESDARAAMKAWTQTVAIERGIAVDPALLFLTGVESIRDAFLTRRIDAMAMPTMEYWAMRQAITIRPTIILGLRKGKATEEYLLLVHRDTLAPGLAHLRGRSLAIAGDARGSLAEAWIETLLLEAGLGPVETFFGKHSYAFKQSRVVLPVFFRQTDACVVTREGFRLLCELNPQLGQQLKVFAESPAYLPNLFCFRGDLDVSRYERIFDGLDAVTFSAAGRQTLALFQTDQVVGRPVSDADATLALLDRHQRLMAESAANDAADLAPEKILRTGPGEP